MTATAIYKGYIMTPIGFETIQVMNAQGYRHNENRMTYFITRPDGVGLGKAWSMKEARAIINEDIAGRM